MRRIATMVLGLFLCGAVVTTAHAQDPTDVTVADINFLPQDSIDVLEAGGVNLSANPTAIFNDLLNTRVRFTAVVLTDPRNSGLSTPNNGLPSRVHVWVRDTTAASLGNAGMTTQVVDGSWQTTGLLNVLVGDVIEVVGTVSPFFNTMQIAPETITVLGPRETFGLPESILDPVVVTTADLNKSVGANGEVQANWPNFPSHSQQYVRIENATLLRRDISTERPNWLITTDNGVTSINIYDTSLRYRNDRCGSYDDTQFNPRCEDFVPPPPGSKINLQGFLIMNNDDPFNTGLPGGLMHKINPWLDGDLEVTETPPIVDNVSKPDFVPGTDPLSITADAYADPTRSITSVNLKYYTSSAPDTMTVAGTVAANDTTYSFDIPGQGDGDFVTYYIEATDNQNATTKVEDQSYRVLAGGINSVSDIQLTIDSGEGASPFVGVTTAMNINGTILSRPDSSGWYILQDGVDENEPWTGIVLEATDAVNALGLEYGDNVDVTAGTIREIRGGFRFDRSGDVTAIENPTVALNTKGFVTSEFYKTVTTDVLQDPAVAEAHESMMLRFENVVVTTNQADAPNDFGEWAVSSDGTEGNQVRVDDASPLVSSGFNDDIVPGSVYSFHQGVWSNTFGNFKLMPEDLSDIGEVTNVSNETLDVPDRFALEQNYPNPFNPSTTIAFDVGAAAKVKLEVFDILGRRVAVLADREYAAGTYTATFDARGFASGMYIYQLTAGSEILTKSMMLLK